MGLLDHVAIALDFSEPSLLAARALFQLAKLGHTRRITVIHATMGVVMPSSEQAALRARLFDLENRVHRGAEVQVNRFIAQLPPLESVVIDYAIRGGKPAQVIPQLVDESGATMLAVGHHMRTGLIRLLSGSVAEVVIKASKVPTLVLAKGQDGVTPETELMDFTRALIAIDLDEDNTEVVRQGMGFVRAVTAGREARVTLLAVVDPFDDEALDALAEEDESFVGHIEDYQVHLEAQAAERLLVLASPHRTPGMTVETLVQRGQPDDLILSVAGDVQANLVVVGSRGHFLNLGSVARQIVRHADVSVLVVPSETSSSKIKTA